MRERLSRVRWRNTLLFLVVAGAVAVVGVIVGREAGLQGGAAVATEEPLTLKLNATQQICETDDAFRISGGESWKDEDGNWHEKLTVYGWGRVSTVPVRWQVSGGQAPYTLVIDHETQDEHRGYFGASGVARVGCADASVGTSFWWGETGERMYDTDPRVDSGWKTVNAVVTDANGDTATASTEFYVILIVGRVDHLMRGGETYRVFGRLITAPQGYALTVGDHGFEANRTTQGFSIVGSGAAIEFDAETFEEVQRWLPEPEGGVDRAGTGTETDLHQTLDQVADSIGKLPDLSSNGR